MPRGQVVPPGLGPGSRHVPAFGPPQVPGHPPRPGLAPPPQLPRDTWRAPTRIEQVPGTNFAVGYLTLPPTTSGLAVGSLVTGIASILIAFLVGCFGLTGVRGGWGGWVAGAFAVLAGLIGTAAVGLGIAGMRQVRQQSGLRGRGLAIAGLVCGASGVALTLLAFATVLLLQVG
jgi:hypothetical protein